MLFIYSLYFIFSLTMYSIQRFINWQAAAIHQTDPGALVTVGSWSEHAITNTHSDSRNPVSLFHSIKC